MALATDFYELTMAAAYYYSNNYSGRDSESKKIAIFELFVRKLPANKAYIVTAGLEQALYFLANVKFNQPTRDRLRI
jgi:nicotinate phosphoribosyltransferase